MSQWEEALHGTDRNRRQEVSLLHKKRGRTESARRAQEDSGDENKNRFTVLAAHTARKCCLFALTAKHYVFELDMVSSDILSLRLYQSWE